MAWSDANAPSGLLRYRIRRESMDKQYEWLSDETVWTADVPPTGPGGPALALIIASSNPSDAVIQFELLNARAGPLHVQVFDPHGRIVVHNKTSAASGSGRDSFWSAPRS
jgi:hypothetical protein